MENSDQTSRIGAALERIARALDTIAGTTEATASIEDTINAYLWDGAEQRLLPVRSVNRVPLALLEGVAHLREILLGNTLAFARGHGANNALLWGARGMGKSSMVKAIHAHIAADPEPEIEGPVIIADPQDIPTGLQDHMPPIVTWHFTDPDALR